MTWHALLPRAINLRHTSYWRALCAALRPTRYLHDNLLNSTIPSALGQLTALVQL